MSDQDNTPYRRRTFNLSNMKSKIRCYSATIDASIVATSGIIVAETAYAADQASALRHAVLQEGSDENSRLMPVRPIAATIHALPGRAQRVLVRRGAGWRSAARGLLSDRSCKSRDGKKRC